MRRMHLRGVIARHSVWVYVILAYVFSWSIYIPLALADHGILGTGMSFKLHYLAQFGPMASAIVVTAIVAGRAGLRELARRVGTWRVGPFWWLVALGPVILFAVAAVVARAVDGAWPSLHEVGELNFLPYLGLAAVPFWMMTNGFGEEIGWRGFLLPALQRGRGALKATLMLWPIWVGWHIPAFFYLPSYKSMGVAGILSLVPGILAGAILLTWLYNGSGASLLMVVIWHGLFNLFTASAAGHGTVAAVMSTLVMVWAVAIVLVARPEDLAGWRRRPIVARAHGSAES